jgi:L,D-transpeptidase ErfK/SrfK
MAMHINDLYRGSGARLAALAVLLLVGRFASAEIFPLAAGDGVIGAVGEITATYEDTLTDIARRHGLGYREMVSANPGVDPWLPGEGSPVKLPTQFVLPVAPRQGLVVNIAEYRVYFFSTESGETRVSTFPISIGRMDWSTPLGRASVVSKVRNPAWYPPDSIRAEHEAEGRPLPKVVPPGPDNPLGAYAMRLSVPGYLIHGTNRPAGVGMRVTHGCIRMYPEDIEWLFPKVPANSAVQLVNQPYKWGWLGDDLYLEVHAPLEDDAVALDRGLTAITELYVAQTRDRAADVDWQLVDRVYAEQLGVPVRVGSAVIGNGAAPAVAANASLPD